MAAKRILLTGAAVVVLSGVVWAAVPRPHVALTATPSARTVTRGQAAVYEIVLKRTATFGRTVQIHISDVPQGTRVMWLVASQGGRQPQLRVVTGHRLELGLRPHVAGRAILILKTSGRTPVRKFRPLVSAHGETAHATLRLQLAVRRPQRTAPATPFGLSGVVAGPLRPGTSQPLELTVSNPFKFALRVTKLNVAVADATSAPGCSGRVNYLVEPARVAYPLVVPPGSSRLSDLVGVAALPQVAMLDLPANQDACKGARVQLELSGTAAK